MLNWKYNRNPYIRFTLFVFIMCFFWIAPVSASPEINSVYEIIYVDQDATTGADDGSSWEDAYLHLQDALDEANSMSMDHYEIWVAEGDYYPDLDSDGDHTADSQGESFTLKHNNVRLYGGFSGTETSRDQRDWQTNVTILSGDIDSNDHDPNGDHIIESWSNISGDNAYHVVYLNGTWSTGIDLGVIVDGFVITAGSGTGVGDNSKGGGLFCDGDGSGNECSPTLSNLTFIGNLAGRGGGLTFSGVAGVSNPHVKNVVFSKNSAGFGGGMYVDGSGGESNPILTNLGFVENHSDSYGAGLAAHYYSGIGDVSLTNALLIENTSDQQGGGVWAYSEEGATLSLTITNASFYDNAANMGGGIMMVAPSSIDGYLNNLIMWDDSATVNGPEIYNNFNVTVVIKNSDIQGSGGSGGSWDTSLGTDGGGNIDQDPLFIDAGCRDLRLDVGSPAIDAGDQALLPDDLTDLDEDAIVGEPIPFDLEGRPRVVCNDVDMGAYENQICKKALADFDGDGDTDLSVFKVEPWGGMWYIKDQSAHGYGNSDSIPVPGDYDGDGTTDVAVFNDGTWYIKDQFVDIWGDADSIPVSGDYDGNGDADLAVFKVEAWGGMWYIKDQSAHGYGNSESIPVPGDYDGDGTTDVAVYNDGTWYVKDQFVDTWGDADSIPVPGDYNGDGTTDLAVFKVEPWGGMWYIKNQSAHGYGNSDSIPVPGDYDGDGTADVAVYNGGTWYVKDQFVDNWGDATSYPLPAQDTNGDGDPYE